MDAHIGMLWKLRRIAAGHRQQDVAAHIGTGTARYRALERGEVEPTELDRRLIERFLPPLPTTESHPPELASLESSAADPG